MKIRKALKSDYEECVRFIRSAIEEQANLFSGSDDNEVINQEMYDYFKSENNRCSHDICDLVEFDGKVIGSMISCSGAQLRVRNAPILNRLKEKFPNEKEYEKWAKHIDGVVEASDDEYYIDNIGIDISFRGKGIGTRLIRYAEEKALNLGMKKVSMLADVENEKAFQLYVRLGYEYDYNVRIGIHEYRHLVKNI